LEKLSNDDEYQRKMNDLVHELRVWKEKVRKLEEQQDKDEHNRQR